MMLTQVAFEGMRRTAAVETSLRMHAAKLERFCPRITSCRIVAAAPHHRRSKGRRYAVRIDLALPGAKIVVNREHALDQTHEDMFVVIRDAFDAARRRLADFARTRRGDIKHPHVSKRDELLPPIPASPQAERRDRPQSTP